ncbi:murein L,D-transpeptidase catalytic domain family protein [Pedobacter sp.]|uniref:murein L,D-transpeptidase catalytic domain family protein n=1 Tax=Pedobacter sp. TaxID=1411316 RepID=UPI003D7F52BF
MRKYILGLSATMAIGIALTISSWTSTEKTVIISKPIPVVDLPEALYNSHIRDIYVTAQLANRGLSLTVFEKAVTGFYNLRNIGKVADDKSIISIADFDQNSTKKRLWIIDLDKKELLLNTWVAHGQNSGADIASKFSNVNNSFQSSVGFYVTGEIYNGQHGQSLRLDGMDEGFNSNARKRAIVVHGADYVSQGTINALGRLGRSHGCPAVPSALAATVINTIGGKTVLFINSSNEDYTSKYLNQHQAALLTANTLKTEKTLDTPSRS